MPGYPEVRVAIAPGRKLSQVMDEYQPDAVHIPVEGPLGMACRRECINRRWLFTTSLHTRFGTYLKDKYGIPEGLAFAFLRWFHRPAAGLMVQTDSLADELTMRGFRNLVRWGRGVDTDLFWPRPRGSLPYERPIFGYVGRVSVEKNIEAMLDLDLPGTKLIIGDGPQRSHLESRYPEAVFVGFQDGDALAQYYSELDVLVFASRFETFGLVVLEALACGTPVAAFPVHGPIDIIGGADVGVLDDDLRQAALGCLDISRERCVEFAQAFSWRRATEQFLSHLTTVHH